MGTIKDINDLVIQVLKSVKDRDIVAKITTIQTLISIVQTENSSLVDDKSVASSENLELKKKIFEFEKEVSNLKEIIKKMKDDDGGGGFSSGVVVSSHF